MAFGGYTLSTIQDEALAGRFSDSKYRPLIATWANEGQRYIYRRSDLRDGGITSADFTTVAGTATLSVPARYARLVDLRNTTDQRLLLPMDLRDFDELTASSGSPTSYVIVGETINLYPTPDQAYSLELRYYTLPGDMTSPTDAPTIPEEYQHLLVRYVLVHLYEREGDFEAAAYWQASFDKGFSEMRGELQFDTFDGPRQVPGIDGSPFDARSNSMSGVWR